MATEDADTETSEEISKQDLSKLSHKQRRNFLKKQKRKLQRQAAAKERDALLAKEEEAHKNSPTFQAKLEQQAFEEQAELLRIEDESRRQHELWLWHEEMFAEKMKRKKEQAEKERLELIEIERKIKEEWEERQKKEKEEEEERRKKREKQEELLRKAREAENKDGGWSNPLAPVQYGKERQIETCPFFAKVGACRFGDRCSRGHPFPESGRTLMFTAMFRHFQLDQGLCEEFDTDITLEYEDSEVYQKFKEFYEDTLPEFQAIGHVIQFKVCSNYQPHLRGNVYIAYDREDDAMKALIAFNARWYGGKQLSAQFVNIPSWRRAICGLFAKGRCPKGRECNFLHVFKNPSSEFNLADRDMETFRQHNNHDHRSQRRRSRSRSKDRRRHSRSPSYRRHKHSRSRSRERHKSYRSMSRRSGDRHSRSRSKDRHSVSRSKDRHSVSRSNDRHSVSRSNDRHSVSHRHKSKSRSPENGARDHKSKYTSRSTISRSRSRSRERSKKRRTHGKRESKRDSSVEGVWVEKTVQTDVQEANNASRSKSPSRERSRSLSADSHRSSRHKKKKKHKKSKD